MTIFTMFAHCICVDRYLPACLTPQRTQRGSKLFNRLCGLWWELILIQFHDRNMCKAINGLSSGDSDHVVMLQEVRILIEYTCAVLRAD